MKIKSNTFHFLTITSQPGRKKHLKTKKWKEVELHRVLSMGCHLFSKHKNYFNCYGINNLWLGSNQYNFRILQIKVVCLI